MEKETKSARRLTDPADLKKPRTMSFSDNEYKKLLDQAEEQKLNASAYIIKKCKLNSNQ